MNKIFNVQTTLLRKSNLEDHNMDLCLFKQTPVTFEINVKHSNNEIEGKKGFFNVNVDLTLKSFVAEKDENDTTVKGLPIYSANIRYSGIFLIEGFSPEELVVILAVNCPSLVFPYARAEMNRLLSETQMQKPHLQPIQFDTMYHQKVQKDLAAKEAGFNTED